VEDARRREGQADGDRDDGERPAREEPRTGGGDVPGPFAGPGGLARDERHGLDAERPRGGSTLDQSAGTAVLVGRVPPVDEVIVPVAEEGEARADGGDSRHPWRAEHRNGDLAVHRHVGDERPASTLDDVPIPAGGRLGVQPAVQGLAQEPTHAHPPVLRVR
jgi:hypothetical protein